MSEKVDELKEIEKKKLDAAYETYNGGYKEAELEPAAPAERQPRRRPREGSGDPNLGVLLIVAGIILFVVFSGIVPRFGIWGWLLATWLVISVLKKNGGRCGW